MYGCACQKTCSICLIWCGMTVLTECSSVGRAIDCSDRCRIPLLSEINWSLLWFRPLGYCHFFVLKPFAKGTCLNISSLMRHFCVYWIMYEFSLGMNRCQNRIVLLVDFAHDLHDFTSTLPFDGSFFSAGSEIWNCGLDRTLFLHCQSVCFSHLHFVRRRSIVLSERCWIITEASLATSDFVRHTVGRSIPFTWWLTLTGVYRSRLE